mmetsp:Transcript_80629/g.236947  ORF Transcript_80629/g.236947 Transcript_80629/m.236947 type:complete len:733 (-) Transcript_80629:156-2354(-)
MWATGLLGNQPRRRTVTVKAVGPGRLPWPQNGFHRLPQELGQTELLPQELGQLPQELRQTELVGGPVGVALGRHCAFATPRAVVAGPIYEEDTRSPPYLGMLATCGSLFRLIVTYCVSITTCVGATLALAQSIQLFFSIFVNLAYPQEFSGGKPRNQAYVLTAFVLTPFGYWLMSVLVDQMYEVILDTMHHPPLLKFRSMLLVLRVPYALADGACILAVGLPVAAILCLLLYEIASGTPLNAWTLTNIVHQGFSDGALMASLLLGAAYTVVRLVHHFSVPQEHLWITMERLELRELGECCCRPVLSGPADAEAAARDSRNGRREAATRMTCMPDPRLASGVAYFLCALVLLALAGAMVKMRLLGIFAALGAILVCLLLIARGGQHFLPGFLGPVYYGMVVVFGLLAVGLQCFASGATSAAEDTVVPLFDGPGAARVQWAYPTSRRAYPVCHQHWGSPVMEGAQRLAVQDLAAFAEAVYFEEEMAVRQIQKAFRNTNLGVPTLEFMKPEAVVGKWASWVFPASKVRVLAIRGTWTRTDALVDAEIYAAVEIMQVLDFFTPVLSMLHVRTSRALTRAVSTSSDYFNGGHIWDQLIDEAAQLRARSDAEGVELIVTGHSLGGLLGIIAGAMTRSKSVVFSPPGQFYTLWRYDIKGTRIRSTATVINPHRDPVAGIDFQMGSVQHIDCASDLLKCHSVRRTRCTLFQICGDPRGRDMKYACVNHSLGDPPPNWLPF